MTQEPLNPIAKKMCEEYYRHVNIQYGLAGWFIIGLIMTIGLWIAAACTGGEGHNQLIQATAITALVGLAPPMGIFICMGRPEEPNPDTLVQYRAELSKLTPKDYSGEDQAMKEVRRQLNQELVN